MHQIAGIVLAGGRSSRFGSDKGLHPYQGKPLAEHAIDILRPNFPTLIVSTNNPDAYAYLDLPMVTDIYPGCGPIGGIYSALSMAAYQHQTIPSTLKPLNSSTPQLLMDRSSPVPTGSLPDKSMTGQALSIPNSSTPKRLNSNTTDPKGIRTAIAIISCDTPHVPPELFAFLRENLAGYDAVVPVHEGFKEATCAIYTSACLPYLDQAMNHKRYKILDALKQANILFLDVTSADFYKPGMFHNINYLADVEERRR